MTVEVRAGQAEDAEALAALAAVTFALACPPGTSPEAIQEFIRTTLSEERFSGYLADPARDIRLALDGRVPAGYTMLVFGEPADADVSAAVTFRPTVELSKVYVHVDHHGAGIAALLMAATVDAARARAAAGVWLGVNKRNGRAIRFYEKSGFSIVGAKTFMVGSELHHDHVMARAL
ncbi:MAG: GCN5-related N-acetyltransferase [Cryobacterium sp.]|jgi:ribosomal protein S18 acetylase RimI-like enzyme|nr:GCN5-related N-acetyltransferase [Cryobacterium sp.]